jgi:hypothetical protein
MTTKTYRAEFFTAADYAARNFEAETPQQAIELARRFYDENIIELDFRSYDDNAGLEQIQIWDNERGTLATWESDDYRLRQAAPDLYKALDYFFNIMHDYGSSRRKGYIRLAMEQARVALAKADQRQSSGNDEEWIELDQKAADARAAIAEATTIKD